MRSTRLSTLAAGALAVSLVLLAAGPAQAADPWWYEKLNMAANHEETKGKGARVLVFDTEIDPTVPELRGADLKWSLQCEASKTLGTKLKKYGPTSAANSKDANHGTAMTALIAGQGNGLVGMAPDASVLFVAGAPGPEEMDVCTRPVGDLAVKQRADIVTHAGNYLTSGNDVKQLQRENIVLVAAAGNQGTFLDEPASRPGVVAVGAAEETGYPWIGNSMPMEPTEEEADLPVREGEYITVLAPGVDVPAGAGGNGEWMPGHERTGTSAATSIVAGALALVKSKYPEATGNQLIQHLIHETGQDEFEFLPESGFGIVSVTKMLDKDPTGWPDINPLMESPEDVIAKYPPSIYGKYPGATTVPEPGENSETGEGEASDEAAGDEETAAASEGDDSSIWMLVIGLGVLALAVVAGVVFLVRRRSRSAAPAQE